MLSVVTFKKVKYKLVITLHARLRMQERQISEVELIEIIEKGKVKSKGLNNKFWIYKKVKNREDNNICLSVSVEEPFLILITTLINWSPEL